MYLPPTDHSPANARCRPQPQSLCTGIVPSWFVYGPFSATYFTTFERARAAMADSLCMPVGEEEGAWVTDLMCGVMAGTTAAAVSHPIDCLKTRIQVGVVVV